MEVKYFFFFFFYRAGKAKSSPIGLPTRPFFCWIKRMGTTGAGGGGGGEGGGGRGWANKVSPNYMILFDRVYEKHNFLLKKKFWWRNSHSRTDQRGGKGQFNRGVGYMHTYFLPVDSTRFSHHESYNPPKKNLWKLRVLKEIPWQSESL